MPTEGCIMAVGKTDCMTFRLQVLSTARTCINLGRGISSSVNKYLKMHWIQRLAKQQRHKTSRELVVLSVMCFKGPDNILTLISENIATREDKRLEFCPHFPVHFSFSPTFLSLPHSPLPPALCGGLLNLPSSSYHPLWVGRIFHTAFGLRLVKHLGHRTKYRNRTWRQTQPPAAISSQAILIAGKVVWVIPSVIHNEALSLFPAQ